VKWQKRKKKNIAPTAQTQLTYRVRIASKIIMESFTPFGKPVVPEYKQ